MEEAATLTKEHEDAIQGLTDLIGNHPKAYNALAASYGAPVSNDHETQVAQAMHLLMAHPDFEQRFEKEVASVKGFDIGKIFEGIKKAFQTIGKIFTPIVNAIKKAVQKHKAEKAGQKPPTGGPKPDPEAARRKRNTIFAIIGFAVVTVTVIVIVLFVDDEKEKKTKKVAA